MSELARRRYEKAATPQEAKPADMLAALHHELEKADCPDTYAMVIRAHKSAEGVHFILNHAGDFNIAERIGLMQLVLHRISD